MRVQPESLGSRAQRVCLCRACVLTVEVAVSLSEGGLQVGAQPGDGSFDLCVALLAQLLLHFHRAAGETLWTNFERGSCKTRDIDAVQYRQTNDEDQKSRCSKSAWKKKKLNTFWGTTITCLTTVKWIQ